MSFVHIHVHSTYSILDGLCSVKALVRRAAELGMPAIALTDHGVMFGAIEFYHAAIKAGIKPIIGLETYLAPRSMTDRDSIQDRKPSHILLIAENETGYQNLLKIASASQLEGFYYYPRIDHDFLAQHKEGIIATTGCMSSEISHAILQGTPELVHKKLDWYFQVFGRENFFFELQHHNIPELHKLNQHLIELGKHYNAHFVAANDVHYLKPEDNRLQDVLLCLQTGKVLSDPNRMRMTDNTYYLRSPQEMKELFGNVPGAIENTLAIAERCNVDLSFKGYHLPHFDVPAGYDAESYLRKLCYEGLTARYGAVEKDSAPRQRLDYELDVIHRMGFDAYFLIVWDLCRFARQKGIWYNTRGSGAGSIVAYTLEITNIDPLAHGLIFERFLNPGRITMPDIDLDFQDDRRFEMMEYCANKYGADKVAQIITFNTMKARAAIRDVGRVMEIPLGEVDKIAKLIPSTSPSIEDALQNVIEFKQVYEEASRKEEKRYIKELIDIAAQMVGVVRSVGTHAAGVVITDKPLVDYLPLHRPTGSAEETPIKTVTQYEMNNLADLGLLKVDFLGLVTLTIMERAIALIKQRTGKEYNLSNIPLDDPKAFELLGKGETLGVFQVESAGMRRYLVEMKPKSLDNVIAMVALYRPGPMDFIPQYIRRMHNEEAVEYLHPAMEPIFKETYGIPVYQEQIMRAAVELAGYTASEADELRKAISKKQNDQLLKHQEKFVNGAAALGKVPPETAKVIFENWEKFARYGFNKAHAADYGIISVQTAYLKANYPVEYMTALISANKNDTAKVALYIADCRRMGIDVLPPDINASEWDFTIEDVVDKRKKKRAVIRFGLGAIKNVGQGHVELILKARKEGGRFKDLNDLAERVDLRAVGKRPLECMIKVGALDQFGSRKAMLEAIDRIVAISEVSFEAARRGQMSLFEVAPMAIDRIELAAADDVSPRDYMQWERELLGLYVSAHPLQKHVALLEKVVSHYSAQLQEASAEERVRVAGLVCSSRSHQTKNGKLMGFATIEDIQGTIDLVIFPKAWEDYHHLLEPEKLILVEGKVDQEGSEPKIIVDKIYTELNVVEPLPQARSVPVSNIVEAFENEDEFLSSDDAASDEVENDAITTDDAAAMNEEKNQHHIPVEDVSKSLLTAAVYDNPLNTAQSLPTSVVRDKTPETNLESAEQPLAQLGDSEDKPRRMNGTQPQAAAQPILPPATEGRIHQKITLITVNLYSNGDKKRDELRLRRIFGTLISHPGSDKFIFNIVEKNKRYRIEFPNYTTGYNEALMEELRGIVREEDISIEELAIG